MYCHCVLGEWLEECSAPIANPQVFIPPSIWCCSILYSHHCLCPRGEFPYANNAPTKMCRLMPCHWFLLTPQLATQFMTLEILGDKVIHIKNRENCSRKDKRLRQFHFQSFSQCLCLATSVDCSNNAGRPRSAKAAVKSF